MDLKQVLSDHTIPGSLYKELDENYIECYACAHRCKIKQGMPGICKVRFNDKNILRVPHGYVGAFQCDPIEKKPFFHAFSGSMALSFGMLGCDFKCSFCQNWDISQTLRDKHAGRAPKILSAEQIVDRAEKLGARAIVSTYNEPLITTEWAVDVFSLAQDKQFATGFVSNGHATPEVLDYLVPHINMYKVDLKSFNERNYKKLGGNLDAVLETIELLHKKGVWVEIVTLLIPDYNDSTEEIHNMAEFISQIDKNIPWHITGFHPDYKMQDRGATSSNSLTTAVEIGKQHKLNFVYAGNRPGMVKNLENTYCHNCEQLLIERRNFRILNYNIKDGKCFKCNTKIPGLWENYNGNDQRRIFLVQ